MCVYSKRLLKEWINNGKIIIAVDYDDTIRSSSFLGNDKDMARTIKLIKKAKNIGAYIVIFTAAKKERYNEIIRHCRKLDIDLDTININPIPLEFGNDGKIGYHINLCDRSGLKESLKILKKAMKSYKLYKSNYA